MSPRSLLRSSLTAVALLVALACPAVSNAQSAAKKTHTISVAYAGGAWNYSVLPAQPDPKKVKVKRGDTLNFVSADGSWTVFFKDGSTPLDDANGRDLMTVSAPAGTAAGGRVAVKHASGATFSYGVRIQLPNGQTVEDDPEIIIE